MDRAGFWNIIDECRKRVEDPLDLAPLVTEHLESLPADEIISFEQHLWDLMTESYRWDLWAVAYIVNGGCSDDGFDYFRGWLISLGRECWERAMANPEVIGEWTDGEVEYEEILYVATQAYEDVTGQKSFPKDAVKLSIPEEPAGQRWDEEDVDQLYPALSEKFGA